MNLATIPFLSQEGLGMVMVIFLAFLEGRHVYGHQSVFSQKGLGMATTTSPSLSRRGNAMTMTAISAFSRQRFREGVGLATTTSSPCPDEGWVSS